MKFETEKQWKNYILELLGDSEEYGWYDVIRDLQNTGEDCWQKGNNFFCAYTKDVKMICEKAMKKRAIKMWQIVGYDDAIAVIYRRRDQ